jgi:uncharacterized protein (DUF488 family)
LALLYTIGHSTRSLDDLVEALQAHSIQALVDIRAFPRSRRLPHFNSESLVQTLPEAGIRYLWMPTLGGYRKKIREDSPNIGLRNESFRNYADYMLTEEFEKGTGELVSLAGNARVAYMCAERVYSRCHRMLVSDWLVSRGHDVMHIDGIGPATPHRLSDAARIVDGEMIYRGDRLL